jgi:hypothetical protein
MYPLGGAPATRSGRHTQQQLAMFANQQLVQQPLDSTSWEYAASISTHAQVQDTRRTISPPAGTTQLELSANCPPGRMISASEAASDAVTSHSEHLQRGAAAVQAGAVLAAVRLQRPKEYGIPPGRLDSMPPATRGSRSQDHGKEHGAAAA